MVDRIKRPKADGDFAEVEKIVKKITTRDGTIVEIKWKNYDGS